MDRCVICNGVAPFKCTACKTVNYCGAEHQKKDWPKHKINCRPFKIEQSNELGRYLVATRDIPAKSTIFIEPPFVIGPKWCLNDDDKCLPHFPCVGCFKPTLLISENHCCPKCLWPACQNDCAGLNDPQMHGLECFILCMRRGPDRRSSNLDVLCNFYRSDVLLILRCIQLQCKYSERWEKIMKLESHDQQRIGTRYYKDADQRIVTYLIDNFWPTVHSIENELNKTILPVRDRQTLHRICGIMEVNALNISLEFGQTEEVSALFENACLLEHSCYCNCYYTFDTKKQFKIRMQAGRLIKKGEHLSIMYTHMLWGTHMRQDHLLTNKYFVCKCVRCIDPTELGTNFSAMKCIGDIGKSCGGTLLPKNPIDIMSEWFCDRCDVSITNEQIEIILSNIEQEVDDLMAPSVSRLDPESRLNPHNYMTLIEKLSNLLHENHYHLFALKHTFIQMYGHQPNYLLHQLSDKILSMKISMCQQLLDVLDHIDPHTMRLTLYTGIVLYELQLAILEQNRRNIANGGINDENTICLAQNYLQRGKEAISLNKDIPQGCQLFESFERAENELKTLFNN